MDEKLLTAEQNKALQQKVVNNIFAKIRDGKTPTQMEMSMLDKFTASNEKRSNGTYAKNQSELADAIGVDRKTIQRWKKDPTFPKSKPDGRFLIADVIEWKDAMGKQAGDLTSKESAQVKSILLQNEKLEIQLGILKGDYTPNEDIDAFVSEVVQNAKRELLALPASLAPQVVGQSIANAEKIIKQSIADALKALHEQKWHDGKA